MFRSRDIPVLVLCVVALRCTGAQQKAPNQHKQCRVGEEAWPKLWLDVAIFIDNSDSQTSNNFAAMKEQIKAIWTNDGGPKVGQGIANTRVALFASNRNTETVAHLDTFRSNEELFNAVDKIERKPFLYVDGDNLLVEANAVFGPNRRGDRPNVPNVVIIYVTNWDSDDNDACIKASMLQEQAIVIVVEMINQHTETPSVPKCISWPGEMYSSNDPGLDEKTLTSLAYVLIAGGECRTRDLRKGDYWLESTLIGCCYGRQTIIIGSAQTYPGPRVLQTVALFTQMQGNGGTPTSGKKFSFSANCFCNGEGLPSNGAHLSAAAQQSKAATHEVWLQFWMARADKNHYLRDKAAECVIALSPTRSNQNTAMRTCHDSRASLPNEFSADKHDFLLEAAQKNSMGAQWIGLQYDSDRRQYFWDDYDMQTNQTRQIPVQTGDYTNWNVGQPDTSSFRNCFYELEVEHGTFKWTSNVCTGLTLTSHTQYLCQKSACDALNYCSDY